MTPTDIENAALRSGHDLGWRFMMCPEGALRSAKIAIVGLNPGGRKRHGPEWSSEAGNAYWVESWGGQVAGMDPLQRQVQQLAGVLGVGTNDLFCAQFVPFRSNSWDDLADRAEAVAFAKRLWAWTLAQSPAETIVCLGKKVVGPSVAELIGARLSEVIPAGWGDQTIEVFRAEDGRKVVALPHLGRFKLMGRPLSEAAVVAALK